MWSNNVLSVLYIIISFQSLCDAYRKEFESHSRSILDMSARGKFTVFD